MNTMNMPGFSAEASLYKSGEFYQSARACSALPGRQGVLPQGVCTPFCSHCGPLAGKSGWWQICVKRNCDVYRVPCGPSVLQIADAADAAPPPFVIG